MILKIKKRNGSIDDFTPDKITIAMQKAFTAVTGSADDKSLVAMQKRVLAELEQHFSEERVPSVEDVQNLVEKAMMEDGYFDVAKAYIIYRYQHAQKREEEKQFILEKIEKNDLTVTKRSGTKEKFSPRKIKKTLSWVTEGFAEGEIDVELIAQITETNLYEGITTPEISQALVMATRSLIERGQAYARVASRLLFSSLYKDVIGSGNLDYKNFESSYRQSFIRNIKRGVEIGRMDPRLLNFDLEQLSQIIDPGRDDLFVYLGAQTLYDRYFIRDPRTKAILETPQSFWMRVAMGLAINEEHPEKKAMEFYEMTSTLRFVPSTPTLFHSGTPHPQLSSCYLTTIDDSLDHIFKCVGDNAQLSKWSGGIANDWTNLRSMGSLIKGTGVESQGVVPFLKIANDTTVAINRSGRRRGATCAYLEVWHYDYLDFLELRKNTGDERRRTHDMNTASWIPDLFMKRIQEDKEWTLFSPDEVPDLHHLYGKNFDKRYEYYERLAEQGKIRLHTKIRAKDLWKRMIMMLFETGHPWMTFKDPCNVRSPQDHVGVVHSSNLCTEITLNTSFDETAVCNLGSINFAKHVTNGQFDAEKVKETVEVAMRMLDNVVDINFYPTSEARNSNLKHRPVGLGIMGFQDALYLMDVSFDSAAAVEFADYSMEVVSYHAILTSSQLAKERGTYQSYRGSKWDRGIFPVDTLDILAEERGQTIEVDRISRLDWTPVRESVSEHGMRNSNTMACAPTATIANISGCYPTIEPIYKNAYVKSNMSGEFTVINHYLIEDLKKLGLWNETMMESIKAHDGNISNISEIPADIRNKYKEVFDIDPEWLIRTAAHRGKWIDQSQSLNLFIKGTSGKKIADAYMLAWQMGLKTTYYLRSLGASAIEKSTLDLAKQKSAADVASAPKVEERPQIQAAPATPIAQPEVAAPISPEPVFSKSDPSEKPKLSLCKIDDPLCEACQ